MKLVALFKHKREIAVHVPGRGVIYPRSAGMSTMPSPIPDRPMGGIMIDMDFVHKVDLLPEEPDALPPSLEKNSDADFVREYRLTQARGIAQNIKTNEVMINALKTLEESGDIIFLGRAQADAKGNIIYPEKPKAAVQPVVLPQEEPVAIAEPETIEIAAPRKGRPKTSE